MARYSNDGKLLVSWVPAIANKAAPTTTELDAGTKISPFMAKSGIDTPSNQNMVDNATIEDTFDAQGVGTFGGAISAEMFRDATSDTAWNLIVYATSGFVVIRRGVTSATAWTVAQKVEVYPAEMHEPVPLPPATNERAKFKAMWAVTGQPNLKATVA